MKTSRAGYCHFPDLTKADAALCTAYCTTKVKVKKEVALKKNKEIIKNIIK